MNMLTIDVTKSSGETAPFDERKLRNSLEHSGAGVSLINEIIAEIEDELYQGMPTKSIYKKAFSLLRKKSASHAARYKLKRAIMELGPTGYPFEMFIGELLRHQGYEVQVGVMLQGHCLSHEVDVVARKAGKLFIMECKFHSAPHRKNNVQVPLYIQSRFLDIKKQLEKLPENRKKDIRGWVVTNTTFSDEAIKYGNCAGLKLVGWDYPRNGSLKDRIDISGLHPITCLNTLSKKEKQALLDAGIVLCRQLDEHKTSLAGSQISNRKWHKLHKEIKELIHAPI